MRRFLSRLIFPKVLLITLAVLPGRAWAQSGTVTDDGFLSSNTATQQVNLNGQGVVLIVGGSSATVGSASVGTTKTYIKFQLLSSLPQNVAATNVAKATLKLYLSPGTNPSGAIDIYPITSAWTEATLNTSSPPAASSTAFATGIVVGKANSFLVVDVTQLVQEWVSSSLENDGIALVAHTSATYVVFDSKEGIVTSHEPRLEIVLANSGPQGPTGPQGAQGPAGPQGATGSNGASGVPGAAATVQVGPTMTVPAGTPASVLNGGTQNAAVLNFLIPQGPAGPQGPIGINNRGAWNSTTAYNKNDAVFDSASYWAATAANTGSEPSPTNANWQLLAGGIVNRAAWSSATNYNANDAVTDKGSFWLAVTANSNSEPSTSPMNTNWLLLAGQGPQGATGSQGPKGDQGPQGLMGLQGPPGPMPTGAALTTASNTFNGNQTVNGNLILGNGGGVQFADGSIQATASLGGGVPSGYMIMGTTPAAPPGFMPSGTVNVGNTWSTMAPMLTARSDLAAAAVNGKIYAIGGSSGSFTLSAVEVYDPSTNAWSAVASIPTARRYFAAAAVNGKIYAIGGANSSGINLSTVEVYDPSTNAWSAVASMPTARRLLAAGAVNGKIYAIGGDNSPAFNLSTVEVYDTSSNTWSAVEPMPTGRGELAAADANGLIYAIGGSSGGTVEQYSPPVTIFTFIKN